MSINKEWKNIHSALDVICSRYRWDIINDSKVLRNLLADLAPESVKEARAFCNTISCERIKRYISCGKEIDVGYLTYCIEEEMIIPNEWAPNVAQGIAKLASGLPEVTSEDTSGYNDAPAQPLTDERLTVIGDLRNVLGNAVNKELSEAADSVGQIKYSEGLGFMNEVPYGGCSVYSMGQCTDMFVKIPPEYNGRPVKKIQSYTFNDCREIRTVKIPPTVQEMGNGVFSDCAKLERVYFSEGITKIPNSTFWYCYGLKKADIPRSVSEIGKYAFYCCKSLASLDIPEGVKVMEESSFYGCEKMQRISIPATVREIKGYSLGYCNNLRRIDFSGTRELWNSIKKSKNWITSRMSGKVFCSDGVVDFQGA